MKQGWEIKKLGEVCNLYQPRTISGDMLVEDGKYLVYGANGIIGRYNEYNHENSEVLLTCRGATCGTINISNPYSWINGNAMVVQPKNDNIGKTYLQYLLKAVDWGKVITGAAQPQITRQSLSPLDVIIPPREEQERIVAELDCLSGVIERKREQLRELDALAQSIFYQMFGDPITNEKGWEVKRLKDVCSDIIDGDHNPPPKSDNGIPFITISNINKDTKTIELANTYYVTEEYYNSIKPNKKPKKGDVLYTVTGSYGLPVLIKEDIRFCFQRHIGLLRPTDVINSVYLYIWAMLPQTKYQADDIATGIAQKTVSLSGLKQMSIILPSLTLQQEFADKIEAIEKQKELIKKSISETETLFNARMDYYFN